MSTTTFGTATGTRKAITLDVDAHVGQRIKRMLAIAAPGPIRISRTAESAEDIEWIDRRYPLEWTPASLRDEIRWEARASRAAKEAADDIIRGHEPPTAIETAVPLRDYQLRGIEFLRLRKRCLCGDDLGLGKTAIAVGAASTEWGRPAVIVCQTHLQQQWQRELQKFAPGLTSHIAKKSDPTSYPSTEGKADGAGYPDVYIVPYSKIARWADWLIENNCGKFVAFDEAQELRKTDSLKYAGAKALSEQAEYVIGLTATPVYNYGDEIHSILSCIAPGELGTRDEFNREWCIHRGQGYRVRDAVALGTYLQDRKLIIRRRRSDVGRELPPINTIVKAIPFDEKRMAAVHHESQELARQILHGTFEEAGQATRLLDMKLRQATGIAKAAYVSEFIDHLVESGEKIVLAGWHRDVYEVWMKTLKARAVLYTGSESPKQKQESVDRFIDGEADVFIMSLRSGAGLDGLQTAASILIIGELDWSPEVHNQIAGRLNRDGQDDSVTVCYMVAEGGSDPVLAGMLNLKGEQAAGIRDPKQEREGDLFTGSATVRQDDTKGRMLAKMVLAGMDAK
tara:strand:- start:21127 stop:22830 length:1704 start_codon:yes stop_codon:yes gene_type:complete